MRTDTVSVAVSGRWLCRAGLSGRHLRVLHCVAFDQARLITSCLPRLLRAAGLPAWSLCRLGDEQQPLHLHVAAANLVVRL